MPPASFLRHFRSMLLIRSLLRLFFLFYGFDYLAVGIPVSDLDNLDLCLLSSFGSWDEDDKSFNSRYPVASPADFGNGDIVLLTHLNGFSSERPRSSGTATSIAASASVTRIFSPLASSYAEKNSNICLYFTKLLLSKANNYIMMKKRVVCGVFTVF